MAGDAPISPSQVRVQVTPGATPQDWIARISTVGPIEEPVIEVAVSAGCEKRFMRRFTAFADPPEMGARGNNALASGAKPSSISPLASVESLGLPPVPRRRPPSVVDRPMRAQVDAETAPRAARNRPAPKTVASRPAVPPEADAPARRVSVVPSETQVARLLLDVGGPRLKMDIDEPLMRAPASVLAAASGLAPTPDLAGSEDLARLQSLEKTLTELKKESQSAREASSGMKARLAEAESRSRLLPWLLGLLLLASGLAVWLALRLRKQGREREVGAQQWWASGAAPLDSMGPVPVPPPSVAGELIDEPLETPAQRSGAGSGWREPASDEPAMQKTAAYPGPVGFGSLSGGALDSAGPAREVSVEELLDLEQQADFFIALGQEDAAVDLLMSHLRGTGGLSPLPYTKLLEIYKRQGDRGAYERIRARFNRRFNAYAPDWDIGPLQGRALEDYPDVALYLQSIWTSPIDAMAVLEGMLFRKDETQEMFDLPAYKDVLLLYSLARDLWQQGGSELTEVDVLLPLGEPTLTTSPTFETSPVKDYDLTAFELEPHSVAPGGQSGGNEGFAEVPSKATDRH